MNTNKKVKRRNIVLITGLILLFICLIVTGAFLYIKTRNLEKLTVRKNTQNSDSEENKVAMYSNNHYGYSIKYPASLRYQLKENEGGYLNFISFLTNAESVVNGFAIGVSSQSLEAETERIKKSFDSAVAELAEEKEETVQNLKAKRLYYKPKDINFGEERVIVIFNRDNKFTYSISALPEEIDNVIKNFNLIAIVSPNPTKGN